MSHSKTLMEEICGNIEDEHDTQKLIARRSSRESMNSPAVARLPKSTTVSISTYPRMIPTRHWPDTSSPPPQHPAQGQILVAGQYRFDILKKSASRLELIRVSTQEPEQQ